MRRGTFGGGQFGGWRFLCLFGEAVGQHDLAAHKEEVEHPRDVAALLGPDLEDAVPDVFGIGLAELGAVCFQQREPHQEFGPHLAVEGIEKILDRAFAVCFFVKVYLEVWHGMHPGLA